MRSIAITGLGLVGPWGATREGFLERLTSPDPPRTPPLIPDLDFFAIVGTRNKRTKKMDRLSRMASIAARRAVDDARLELATIAPGRGAVVTGSGFGALESILTFHRQLHLDGPSAVDPNVFPPTSHNVAGGHISIEFGFSGPLIHFASGALSSSLALIYGYDLLVTGRADVVLAGGWDLLCPALLETLRAAGLAPPPGGWCSRPLALDSLGPVPAEGVAMLVLERHETAVARGAPIAARFDGGAFHGGSLLCPERGPRHGAVEAATCAALQRAGWAPADVSLVALAADGTPVLDEDETVGLHNLFVETRPAAFSPCAAFGQTFGAAGALALAATIHVLDATTTTGYPRPAPSVPGADHFPRPANGAERAAVVARSAQEEAAVLLIRREAPTTTPRQAMSD